jgi:hypothetical protein
LTPPISVLVDKRLRALDRPAREGNGIEEPLDDSVGYVYVASPSSEVGATKDSTDGQIDYPTINSCFFLSVLLKCNIGTRG